MFSYSTGYYVSPPDDQYLKFKNRCSLFPMPLSSRWVTSQRQSLSPALNLPIFLPTSLLPNLPWEAAHPFPNPALPSWRNNPRPDPHAKVTFQFPLPTTRLSRPIKLPSPFLDFLLGWNPGGGSHVEDPKSSSLEIDSTAVSAVYVSYVLFELSCTQIESFLLKYAGLHGIVALFTIAFFWLSANLFQPRSILMY